MTGTSLDGLDVAAVAIEGTGLQMQAELLEHRHVPLGACGVRLRALCEQAPHRAADIAALAHELGTLHAETIEPLISALPRPVDLVAVHGQTVFHAPPLSWALIDPAPLLAVLDAHLVTDLRTLDLARGGQGAPITPLADWILFRGPRPRTIVNLGGFCNGTHLPDETGTPDAIRGADVCACNHLLDAGARRWLDRAFDEDGAVALSTTPEEAWIPTIVERLEVRSESVNRSLGTGDEGVDLIAALDALPTAAKRLSTLAAGIAEVIARAIPATNEVLLFGGGAHHQGVRRELARRRGGAPTSLGAAGIGVEAREAAAMGVLGALAFDGVDITLPAVTGRTGPARHRSGRWHLAHTQRALVDDVRADQLKER